MKKFLLALFLWAMLAPAFATCNPSDPPWTPETFTIRVLFAISPGASASVSDSAFAAQADAQLGTLNYTFSATGIDGYIYGWGYPFDCSGIGFGHVDPLSSYRHISFVRAGIYHLPKELPPNDSFGYGTAVITALQKSVPLAIARDKAKADIVVALANNAATLGFECGRGAAIGANALGAVIEAVDWADCFGPSGVQHMIAHEIGHIFGFQHDYSHNGSSTVPVRRTFGFPDGMQVNYMHPTAQSCVTMHTLMAYSVASPVCTAFPDYISYSWSSGWTQVTPRSLVTNGSYVYGSNGPYANASGQPYCSNGGTYNTYECDFATTQIMTGTTDTPYIADEAQYWLSGRVSTMVNFRSFKWSAPIATALHNWSAGR